MSEEEEIVGKDMQQYPSSFDSEKSKSFNDSDITTSAQDADNGIKTSERKQLSAFDVPFVVKQCAHANVN